MAVERWTTSMREAWQYSRKTSHDGMTGAEGLAAFRAGGGHIRTQDWYTMMRGTEQADYISDVAKRLPDEQLLPESAIPGVDIKYSQKYQAHFRMTGIDKDKKVYADTWRIIQSDKMLTIGQWKQAAKDLLMHDDTLVDILDVEIEEFEFTERISAGEEEEE